MPRYNLEAHVNCDWVCDCVMYSISHTYSVRPAVQVLPILVQPVTKQGRFSQPMQILLSTPLRLHCHYNSLTPVSSLSPQQLIKHKKIMHAR